MRGRYEKLERLYHKLIAATLEHDSPIFKNSGIAAVSAQKLGELLSEVNPEWHREEPGDPPVECKPEKDRYCPKCGSHWITHDGDGGCPEEPAERKTDSDLLADIDTQLRTWAKECDDRGLYVLTIEPMRDLAARIKKHLQDSVRQFGLMLLEHFPGSQLREVTESDAPFPGFDILSEDLKWTMLTVYFSDEEGRCRLYEARPNLAKGIDIEDERPICAGTLEEVEKALVQYMIDGQLDGPVKGVDY